MSTPDIFKCKICGCESTKKEFDVNDGKCYNCNTPLTKEILNVYKN